jgi:hypothetical protein
VGSEAILENGAPLWVKVRQPAVKERAKAAVSGSSRAFQVLIRATRSHKDWAGAGTYRVDWKKTQEHPLGDFSNIHFEN